MLVEKTKNGKPHTLPLCEYIYELLLNRFKTCNTEYVFPSSDGSSHIVEPKKGVERVRKLSGIHFTIHDLRRTFITIAESLDISTYAVKRMVNHSMENDVTAGYIIWDIERIRKPIEQVSDFLIKSLSNKSKPVK